MWGGPLKVVARRRSGCEQGLRKGMRVDVLAAYNGWQLDLRLSSLNTPTCLPTRFLPDSLAIQTPAAIVFWGSLGRQVLARELRTVERYKKLALSQRLFLGVSRMR